MVDFFQNWWKGGDLEANNFSPAAGYLQCEFPVKIIHKIFNDASLLVRVSKNFSVIGISSSVVFCNSTALFIPIKVVSFS